MKNDKVKITIELQRLENGTCTVERKITGEGIFLYEMVGLLQISLLELAANSIKTGKDLPKGKPIRMVYPEAENQ